MGENFLYTFRIRSLLNTVFGNKFSGNKNARIAFSGCAERRDENVGRGRPFRGGTRKTKDENKSSNVESHLALVMADRSNDVIGSGGDITVYGHGSEKLNPIFGVAVRATTR